MPQALFAACCILFLQQPTSDPEFICSSDQSNRFVAVERIGDGAERNASVVVLEHLPEDDLLKKIYEVTLVNKRQPLTRTLSSDGRFLVTMDEFSASGTGPATLVIYDLARREHSAYSGSDFLDKSVRENLVPRDVFPGFKWHGSDYVFNEAATQFYPTLPENCKRAGVPFVVVNLPSRTVRVAAPEDMPRKSIVKHQFNYTRWQPTQETSTVGKFVLPKRITRKVRDSQDEEFDILPDKVEYKLNRR